MLEVMIGICAALQKISAYLKRLYKTSEIPEGGLSSIKSESSRHFDIAAIRFGWNSAREKILRQNVHENKF